MQLRAHLSQACNDNRVHCSFHGNHVTPSTPPKSLRMLLRNIQELWLSPLGSHVFVGGPEGLLVVSIKSGQEALVTHTHTAPVQTALAGSEQRMHVHAICFDQLTHPFTETVTVARVSLCPSGAVAADVFRMVCPDAFIYRVGNIGKLQLSGVSGAAPLSLTNPLLAAASAEPARKPQPKPVYRGALATPPSHAQAFPLLAADSAFERTMNVLFGSPSGEEYMVSK